MSKYFSVANPPVSRKESGGGKVLVERAGYVSSEKRIKAIMRAGQSLLDYRKMIYDIDASKPVSMSDVENLAVDPTRAPGYDRIDAARDLQRAAYAKRAAIEALKQAEKDKVPPKDETPPN